MNGHTILALVFSLAACGGTSEKPKDPEKGCEEAGEIAGDFKARRNALTRQGDWVTNDCDAALWDAKLHSVRGAPTWKLELAEPEPGRFDRRPAPCWTPDEGDVGSKSTWSRDMGRGVILWAWRTDRRDVLDRHYAYGKGHGWQMGFPIADGRTVYSPALQGALAQTIYAMDGRDHLERRWPDLYPVGLTDYGAHLQVLGIVHRGEVEKRLRTGEDDARPADEPVVDDDGGEAEAYGLTLDVSPDMLARLEEHADREPGNALYQAAHGRYSGDMTPAQTALRAKPWFRPSYVRCGDQAACDEIEWLFAADLYLRVCGK